MQMNDGDIVKSYKEAKNKANQVKILAELNGCGESKIMDILVKGGIDHRALPRKPRAVAKPLFDVKKPTAPAVFEHEENNKPKAVAKPVFEPVIKSYEDAYPSKQQKPEREELPLLPSIKIPEKDEPKLPLYIIDSLHKRLRSVGQEKAQLKQDMQTLRDQLEELEKEYKDIASFIGLS